MQESKEPNLVHTYIHTFLLCTCTYMYMYITIIMYIEQSLVGRMDRAVRILATDTSLLTGDVHIDINELQQEEAAYLSRARTLNSTRKLQPCIS